jgi:hypothetical protein
MTTEERFERIERTLAGTAESLGQLTQSLNQLAGTITRYVDMADARMRRIEDNLDGLIRAITADHSNGKPDRSG